ncbi:hypothetical protein HOI26_01900 [Candidatus Woesearchaeota archaeon]|jgi:hypothetical protein|nr:hypothetical protein [Candidatus Woesearchaeota archaeon]MBT5739830.1 hypothetical protein [Candidatus Woesearchaeota archaeon]
MKKLVIVLLALSLFALGCSVAEPTVEGDIAPTESNDLVIDTDELSNLDELDAELDSLDFSEFDDLNFE